jgi:hypothetical protein
VATEVLADHSARLAPLTDADAADMIHSIRAAPLLLGHRGTPPTDLAALGDALMRVPGPPMTCRRSPNSTSTR